MIVVFVAYFGGQTFHRGTPLEAQWPTMNTYRNETIGIGLLQLLYYLGSRRAVVTTLTREVFEQHILDCRRGSRSGWIIRHWSWLLVIGLHFNQAVVLINMTASHEGRQRQQQASLYDMQKQLIDIHRFNHLSHSLEIIIICQSKTFGCRHIAADTTRAVIASTSTAIASLYEM